MDGHADPQVVDRTEDGPELEIHAGAVLTQRPDVIQAIQRQRIVAVSFAVIVFVPEVNILNPDRKPEVEDILEVESAGDVVFADTSLVDVVQRRVDPRVFRKVVPRGVIVVAYRVEHIGVVGQNSTPLSDSEALERTDRVFGSHSQRRFADSADIFREYFGHRLSDPLSVSRRRGIEIGQFRITYAQREAGQRACSLVEVQRCPDIAQRKPGARIVVAPSLKAAFHVTPGQRRRYADFRSPVDSQTCRIDVHRREIRAKRCESSAERRAACRSE